MTEKKRKSFIVYNFIKKCRMFVRRKEKMSKTDEIAGYADACRSTVTIAKIAKTILPWLIVAVLSVSLVSIAVAAEEEFGGCEACHKDIAEDFATSLHYTNEGMILEWQRGAGDFCELNATEYFEKSNCFKCHTATCTQCHKDYASYPEGHGKTVGLETCDECHGAKRVAAHFSGDFAGHAKEGPHADIHYEMGLNCTDCHTTEEIHGTGELYSTELLAVTVQCEDCHVNPGKTVNEMSVTQFSPDTPSHKIHGEKLDCTACHAGWYQNCINCHLDTNKVEGAAIDEFNLGIAADGQVKPFYHMTAVCPNNETHSAYFEFMPHTITTEAKDCAFCHRDPEVLCEGCEGEILGPEGASFIPSEKVQDLLKVAIPSEPAETPAATPAETPAATPAETPAPPGFELIFAVIAITVVVYLAKRRR
jgi:hypothetical protein